MGIPERLGPEPARTDRPREAALKVLRHLAAAPGPLTIGALNDLLGGHPNTVRAQLVRLVASGFATEVSLPARGRGRPALAFAATVAGSQVALSEPGRDDHRALVEAVADQLSALPDPVAAAHALGRSWGHHLDDDAPLVGVLAAQGFTPQEVPAGIALRTCPLLAAARENPAVVCGIHQGLIDALSPLPRRLAPFAGPGYCLVHPEPDAPPEASGGRPA